MEDFWWARAFLETVWPKYYQLPKEMRHDPLLNKLNISGPFGPDHDRLRRAYYAIRDNKPVDTYRLEESFDYICHRSSGLFNRIQDDTPQELKQICGRVGNFLAMQDRK
jgi:hypothetical protein